jgi:hypothetical protein
MANFIKQAKFHFGGGYPYSLPEGWKIETSPDDFAIGISPEGKRYFIGDEFAFPECHDKGTRFVETEKGVLKFVGEGENPTQAIEA